MNHQPINIDEALRAAMDCYQRREWAQAERHCRAILEQRPDQFDALSILGVMTLQSGRTEEAVRYFRQAVAGAPRSAPAHSNYANALKKSGALREALQSYDLAISLDPRLAQVHLNKALALQELGQFDEALASIETAAQLAPQVAEVHYNFGNLLTGLRRYEEACARFTVALQLKVDYPAAHNNLAVALLALGKPAEALQSSLRALHFDPRSAVALKNAGDALTDLGQPDQALVSYTRAIELNPEAAEAHYLRGNILMEFRQHSAALESYRQALRARPRFPKASYNLGNALALSGRLDDAQRRYREALDQQPELEWLPGAWLRTRMKLCDWHEVDTAQRDLEAGVLAGLPVAVPFVVVTSTDSLELHRLAARRWLADQPPIRPPGEPFPVRAAPDRLRVAYLSADFHEHATAYLIAELFERHDRERFEVYAVSYGPGSDDPMRRRIRAAVAQFIEVPAATDANIAAMARSLGIDIAVDLKGYTQDSRPGIFMHRAAPVQVSYLGYPGTLEAPWMDYLIADEVVVPPASRPYYAEKVVYLPGSYQVNDRQRRIADLALTREELHLPSEGFVFCCFNASYKLTPRVFDSWMRILQAVPGSVLWLLNCNTTSTLNLRREAQARGVPPDRLIFAPWRALPEHLARHRLADLFLDTWPCNAHTTASDALWAGLPVLTLAGTSFPARVAASLATAVGLSDLVVASAAQYESLAIALASDPARLAALRETLARNRERSPLFDSSTFARHIEDAYGQMYERYRQGLGPDHLVVGG